MNDRYDVLDKIDALVGTGVMGWKIDNLYKDENVEDLYSAHYFDSDGSINIWSTGRGPTGWDPTRSMDKAWSIVELLRPEWSFELREVGYLNNVQAYEATFKARGERIGLQSSRFLAYHPALAICLTALNIKTNTVPAAVHELMDIDNKLYALVP